MDYIDGGANIEKDKDSVRAFQKVCFQNQDFRRAKQRIGAYFEFLFSKVKIWSKPGLNSYLTTPTNAVLKYSNLGPALKRVIIIDSRTRCVLKMNV